MQQTCTKKYNAIDGSRKNDIRFIFGSTLIFSWFGCFFSIDRPVVSITVSIPLTGLLHFMHLDLFHAVPFGKSSYVHSKTTIISNCACKPYFSRCDPIRYNLLQSNPITARSNWLDFLFALVYYMLFITEIMQLPSWLRCSNIQSRPHFAIRFVAPFY